ncbi:MAG: glycosyltransferase family 39 protein [Acidobacteriia bacterium]|nr:glycosyltransferase family 39 protein [Terriglobia bacterium]
MRHLRTVVGSLPLILLVALGLRLGFAWQYQHQFSRQALSVIPFLFESGNIAHSVATGNGFSSPFRVDTGPTAWTTPVYPLLLAGIMRLFGSYTFPSYVAAVLLNILFSTLACVPLFLAGKRVGGVAVAAIATWLWAVFPNAILLTYQSLWETSLSALLGATLLWATLRVAESRRPGAWCGYGLLWGLTLMCNATLLSLLPLLLGWAVYRSQPRAWRNALLALGAAFLCCVPWTVRNYVVFHNIVPLRSILGLQLWVGNNPQAKVIWLGDQHPIHDSTERDHYIALGEIAYMQEKEHDALRYMVTHPGREAGLIAGRFVSLWAGGSAAPIHDFWNNRSAWFRYVLLFNLGVACGALWGMVRLGRAHSVHLFPVAIYPLVFPWAYYLTLSLPRYRHPVDPILMLLTAIAVAGVHTCAPRARD